MPDFFTTLQSELNPAEKIWARIKRTYTNQTFKTIELISEFIANQIKSLSPFEVINTCNFEYAFCPSIWTI